MYSRANKLGLTLQYHKKMATVRYLKLYYYITPVFVFIDIFWDQTFRAAGINEPLFRYYYYGFCFLCALLCYFRPCLSSIITLVESSINMTILMLGIILPIVMLGNRVESGEIEAGLSVQKLIAFILSGSLICYSFYTALYEIHNKK